MKPSHEPTPIAVMAARMKPLPRRHRIAHLRALTAQQSLHSTRRQELAALLREMTGDGEGDCLA
jgi:hypothetical protein